jgi:acyl carrier protein
LEYVGRTDNQIKLRGHRVELEEVEMELRQLSGVRQAAAQIEMDERGEKVLVGYVVWEDGEKRGWGEIRSELLQRAPEYMAPGRWAEVMELPLNENGKVDRKKLKGVLKERAVSGQEYEAPRTAEEQILVGIWEKLLGVERVGVHDNFFALGGHSLLATQVVNRVKEEFHVKLSIRKVFESPTVAELIKEIAQALIDEVGAAEQARLLNALDRESPSARELGESAR